MGTTLTRFLGVFTQRTSTELGKLHAWADGKLPSHKGGYTLDMDSWSLLHEEGHQEGVAVGYTRNGPKPCHRPLVAALAEARLVVGYWLRSGNTNCVNGAAGFLRHTLNSLPRHVAVGLVRADSGFSHASVLDELESRHMPYVMATRLTKPIQSICRHDDAAWEETDMEGMEVQEVEAEEVGRRILVLWASGGWREDALGCAWVPFPGVGNESAAEHEAAGGVASVQWSGGHRQPLCFWQVVTADRKINETKSAASCCNPGDRGRKIGETCCNRLLYGY